MAMHAKANDARYYRHRRPNAEKARRRFPARVFLSAGGLRFLDALRHIVTAWCRSGGARPSPAAGIITPSWLGDKIAPLRCIFIILILGAGSRIARII